jgi:nucleoside-diphosphate-sugar epimerase
MTKILITGGAGYLGSSFLKYHADAYDITVFDTLLHGGESLIPYFSDVNFHFIKGDVRDQRQIHDAVKGKDVVIHLAAIVGFPACDENPRLAEETNYEGSWNVMLATKFGDRRVLYASSVSVYGKVEDGICTEDTRTHPLTHYGQTKLRAERALVEYGSKATAFRFPTAFGVAPRMRLDLMPNDLTFQAVKNGGATLYESSAQRTFIHVRDVVKALEMGINRYDMRGQVFNVGDESLNVTKTQLADIIAKETGATFTSSNLGKDKDQRDYEVSFVKIKSLGYKTSVTLEQGIREVAQAAKVINIRNPYSNV